TPPVGLNLFIASFRFQRSVTTLYRAVLPFIGILLFSLALTTYIPQLTTSMANLFGGASEGGDAPAPEVGGEECDLESLDEPGDEGLDLDSLDEGLDLDALDGELDLDALDDELGLDEPAPEGEAPEPAPEDPQGP